MTKPIQCKAVTDAVLDVERTADGRWYLTVHAPHVDDADAVQLYDDEPAVLKAVLRIIGTMPTVGGRWHLGSVSVRKQHGNHRTRITWDDWDVRLDVDGVKALHNAIVEAEAMPVREAGE